MLLLLCLFLCCVLLFLSCSACSAFVVRSFVGLDFLTAFTHTHIWIDLKCTHTHTHSHTTYTNPHPPQRPQRARVENILKSSRLSAISCRQDACAGKLATPSLCLECAASLCELKLRRIQPVYLLVILNFYGCPRTRTAWAWLRSVGLTESSTKNPANYPLDFPLRRLFSNIYLSRARIQILRTCEMANGSGIY